MVTAEFVNEAINGVLDRFEKDDYIQRLYEENIEEDGESFEVIFYVEEEVKHLLNGFNIENQVQLISSYEAMGIEAWVLCIAYLVNNRLEVFNIPVEQRCY